MLCLLNFFLFLFRKLQYRLVEVPLGEVVMETAIKHPQAPQKMMIVAIAEIIIYRGAQWRGCGNRTATLDRERNEVYGVERRGSSVKRRGKNKRQRQRTLI